VATRARGGLFHVAALASVNSGHGPFTSDSLMNWAIVGREPLDWRSMRAALRWSAATLSL
jgi:hypothetical protein